MRMFYKRLHLLTLIAAAGFSLTAAAQAPVNDTCTGALELTCGQTITGNNEEAGDDVLPAADCEDGGTSGFYKGVWYKITAASAGILSVETCGSDFDTYLRIYKGADCDNLTECMGYSDDGNSCDDNGSAMSFAVEEDATYYILLGGYGEDSYGDFTMTATCFEPAANDSCADAVSMTCGQTITGNTSGASDDEVPAVSCDGDDPEYGMFHGVWYKITAASAGSMVVSSCGSDFDTYMRIYKGDDCDNLTECMGANDDGDNCSDVGSTLSFTTEEDATYYILLAGLSEDSYGTFTLTATCYEPATNDTCADAIELTCGETLIGNTSGASDDVVPAAACADDDVNYGTAKAVWYKITPATAGSVSVSTCGSDFDTYLRVYKGDDCDNLTECMGYSDDGGSCDDAGSALSFTAEAGQTYYIMLGGYDEESFGAFTITATCFEPTANDDCADALELECGETLTGNTMDATSDVLPAVACTDDETDSGLVKGVWYKITAAESGTMTISTCGSEFDTYLRAYKGADCDNLTECMGFNGYGNCDNAGSTLSFAAEEGETYYILMGGYYEENVGAFTITANCFPETVNDSCADALELACGQTLTGNTMDATDDVHPAAACEDDSPDYGLIKGVWYTITPASSGDMTISTCGSEFDTYVRVYEGSDCDNLTECMGYSDDGAGCDDSGSELTFAAEANTTYYILMGGYNDDDFGTFTITASCVVVVDSIEVSTQGGVAAAITTDGGTLQMEAAVFPATVDQSVTWSIVPGTGAATISGTGLVTAESNGTVWAKAVSVADNTLMDSLQIVITNQVNVGLDETAAAAGFKVYPNPAKTSTKIYMEQNHPAMKVSVVDVYGRTVSTYHFEENALNTAQELTIENLPQGVYFIKANGSDLNFSVTFIKQ